ncbi:MAG TPA: hypothetical protein VI522_01330 [Gammaproteobacteria bacterium]|nr:hypothetical protein [Gammaproteobacteria bacterium]
MAYTFNQYLTRINEVRMGLSTVNIPVKKFNVVSLYTEYLRYLQAFPNKTFTASEMLVQLKIINLYYFTCIKILDQKTTINQLPALPSELCQDSFSENAAKELNTLLIRWTPNKTTAAQDKKNIELLAKNEFDPNKKIANLIAYENDDHELETIIAATIEPLKKETGETTDLNEAIDPQNVLSSLSMRRLK